MYYLIDEQRLVIEVEGRCEPYEFNWTKLRHTPEATNGPTEWVKLWRKANAVSGIESATLTTKYVHYESEILHV